MFLVTELSHGTEITNQDLKYKNHPDNNDLDGFTNNKFYIKNKYQGNEFF